MEDLRSLPPVSQISVKQRQQRHRAGCSRAKVASRSHHDRLKGLEAPVSYQMERAFVKSRQPEPFPEPLPRRWTPINRRRGPADMSHAVSTPVK